MKRTLLFFLGLVFTSIGYSQSLSPEVTTTAGDHFTGTNVQLSWTIGEIMIETHDNGVSQLTEGFHQTNLIVTAVEDLAKTIQVNVFPNPTTDILNIELSNVSEALSFKLFDVDAKQLLTSTALNGSIEETIDLTPFAAGTYFLQVGDLKENTIKTFKIIKIK